MRRQNRTKKLVNWNLQGPLLLRLVIYMIAYHAALICLLIITMGVQSSAAVLRDSPLPATPALFRSQVAPLLLCMFLMMPFMLWDLMKLTHRVAGPLYRFETALRDFVRSGTLQTVRTRKGDLLNDFEQQFNTFAETLHALHPETRPLNLPPAEQAGNQTRPAPRTQTPAALHKPS